MCFFFQIHQVGHNIRRTVNTSNYTERAGHTVANDPFLITVAVGARTIPQNLVLSSVYSTDVRHGAVDLHCCVI